MLTGSRNWPTPNMSSIIPNNSKHSVTGFSPCELVFGLNQRGKTPDRLTEFIENNYHSPPNRELDRIRETAAEAISKSQRYSESMSQMRKDNRPKRMPSVTW